MRWSDFVYQARPTSLLKQDYDSNHNQLFLRWIQSQFEIKIWENQIEYPFGITYCHTVELTENGRRFFGFGRHLARDESLATACGEALERFLCSLTKGFFGRNLVTNGVSIEDGEISIYELDHPGSLLPTALQNSNGWSVFYQLDKAVYSSTMEALERHLLLYNYLKFGWCSLESASSTNINGYNVQSLIASRSQAGFAAGIALVKSNQHVGYTFGYLCDRSTDIEQSDRWRQALFESYEPALYYDSFTDLGTLVNDKITESQIYYLKNKIYNFSRYTKEPCQDLNKLDASLLILDLAKMYDLNFPLYATQVYGGDLIPLYFHSKLDVESSDYLHRTLARHYISGPLPAIHPVV